jgi:hypothetical protein
MNCGRQASSLVDYANVHKHLDQVLIAREMIDDMS